MLELFDRIDLTFKTVNNYALQATVLVSKSLKPKSTAEYATIVNWHGGGFVIGDRMYEGWLPSWCVLFIIRLLKQQHSVTLFCSPLIHWAPHLEIC